MFLTKEDLTTNAPKSFIDILVATEDEALNGIIAEQIDIIKTNIGAYYDADKVFSAEGEARSKTVLYYLKALVFYHLMKRRKPGVLDPADYNEAMKWLEDISSGNRKADLPKKDEDEDGIPDDNPFLKLGRRKSYQNGW
ncbi:phage protein Gp36 family protein [Riemerella columbipharyngis]|uniref:Mu-like prophage protein gp36 n=1 Tax=Riemerella columbipharyngis TaxID=1071918 RepID=A0A1G7FLM0_9FLAO|nr:phage protein Gp36 family protein [Riemerella columbipharyngis]SDE76748.1 Protein of unknown function [Riemerella columbipharyngis]